MSVIRSRRIVLPNVLVEISVIFMETSCLHFDEQHITLFFLQDVLPWKRACLGGQVS